MRHLAWIALASIGACTVDFSEGQIECHEGTASDCPPAWHCLGADSYGNGLCYSSADALGGAGSGGSGGFAGSGGSGGFAGSGGSGGFAGSGGSGGFAGSSGSGGTGGSDTEHYFCRDNTVTAGGCVCIVSGSADDDGCTTPKATCCFRDPDDGSCFCYPEEAAECDLRDSDSYEPVTTCPRGSPVTLPKNEVACVELGDPTDPVTSDVGEPFCQCDSSGSAGDPEFIGADCGDHPDRQLCCADPSFPDSGSCSCTLTLDWFCETDGATTCTCNYAYGDTSGLQETTVCDNVPEADGTEWKCCAIAPEGSCFCSRWDNPIRTCGMATTEVSDCATPGLVNGFPSPPTGCPSGKVSVTSCTP